MSIDDLVINKEEILGDGHVHPRAKNFSSQDIEKYIHVAYLKGIKRLGLLEHGPRISNKHTGILQTPDDVHQFKQSVIRANKYNLTIKVGIEIDYSFDRDHRNKSIALINAASDIDYAIGSIHSYKFNNYCEYYAALYDLMRSYPIDIVGHIALDNKIPDWKLYVHDIVSCANKYNIAIELNTAPKRKLAYEVMSYLIEESLRYNVRLIYGSDAHEPENIGNDILDIYKLVNQCEKR